MSVFDARILMRIQRGKIEVLKHDIKKEENHLHSVTKSSDTIFAGILT